MIEQFREMRKLLCVCPDCASIVRVTDLQLRVKGKAPKTWLDDFESKEAALMEKEEKFKEKESKLRDEAKKKGREEALRGVDKLMCTIFSDLKINPFDVQPILHPIDFIAFHGMDLDKIISDIMFISKKTSDPTLDSLRKDVKTAIEKKAYEWQVARIDCEGCIKIVDK